MNKRKIVIAEDLRIMRDGLRMLLCSAPGYEVVGEAQDGIGAIRCVETLNPDMVLMDLSMPGISGMGAMHEIRKRFPETKILVLTGHKSDEYVLAAFEAGADGYILKEATHSELMRAIDSIFSGKRYLSPAITEKVIAGYLEGKKDIKPANPWGALTKREHEILKLVGEGHRNKDIAARLYISAKTVEKHRANMMKKLNLHNASSLKNFAMGEGFPAESDPVQFDTSHDRQSSPAEAFSMFGPLQIQA